ncbi:MAG: preprotein translocase subunit SecG [Gammaproteobacteria bacterium]|jgi:preprotein translocase subunit SecG
MIETVLLIVLVCVAIALIGLVLIQHGKGADAGASFGAGASQTVFGSAGSGNFLTKSTWTLGIVFFVCCLALGYIARQQAENAGRFDFSEPAQEEQVPAADVPVLPGDASVPESADSVPATVPAESAETAGVAGQTPN